MESGETQLVLDDDDPDAVLLAVRQRFVAGFLERFNSFGLMIDAIGADVDGGPGEALAQLLHRTAGLGGTIGLPLVSERARQLEERVRAARVDGFDVEAARRELQALGDAFETDLAADESPWATSDETVAASARVLLVEDDPEQRRLVISDLRTAGYTVTAVERGELACSAARALRPDIVLLDVELPGMPGLEVCRQLKSDSDLHNIPVVFISSRGSLDDRLRGLALGADDYVTKPVQLSEVRLRIELTLRRRAAARDAADLALTYDCFVGAATHALHNGPAALALVRISRGDARQVLTTASEELRRRDLVGRYDDAHVILLLPGLVPVDACNRLSALSDSLAGRDIRIVAGIASTTGTASFQELLDEADEALAEARYLRQPVVIHGRHTQRAATPTSSTVLIAEDDPDVTRILDAQLRAAGYQTLLVFDGQEALDAIQTRQPDLVLLDLMMPKMTGFDVLTAVSQMSGRKPKIVVVSGRGRESDVTRAFGLGVEDYLTKPFSPEELVARLHRLTR